MLVFATDQQLETLFSSDWNFLDGTFDSCLSQLKQIYTIHSLKFQQSDLIDYSKRSIYLCRLDLLCVVSLSFGKSTDVYLQLLSELEQHAERLNQKFNPQHVMSNFKMFLIKAVKQKVSLLIL